MLMRCKGEFRGDRRLAYLEKLCAWSGGYGGRLPEPWMILGAAGCSRCQTSRCRSGMEIHAKPLIPAITLTLKPGSHDRCLESKESSTRSERPICAG